MAKESRKEIAFLCVYIIDFLPCIPHGYGDPKIFLITRSLENLNSDNHLMALTPRRIHSRYKKHFQEETCEKERKRNEMQSNDVRESFRFSFLHRWLFHIRGSYCEFIFGLYV